MEWFLGLIPIALGFAGIVAYIDWFARCVKRGEPLRPVWITALGLLMVKVFVFS